MQVLVGDIVYFQDDGFLAEIIEIDDDLRLHLRFEDDSDGWYPPEDLALNDYEIIHRLRQDAI